MSEGNKVTGAGTLAAEDGSIVLRDTAVSLKSPDGYGSKLREQVVAKQPVGTEFIPLAPGSEAAPVDRDVKIPEQVRHAAALADDLIAGKPRRPPPKAKTPAARATPRSLRKVSYSDAQIENALERADRGTLELVDPDFRLIVELAKVGAQSIQDRRRGARKPRAQTEVVARRRALIAAEFMCLPDLHPTNSETIGRLQAALQKNHNINVSDDTIIRDLKNLGVDRLAKSASNRGFIWPA